MTLRVLLNSLSLVALGLATSFIPARAASAPKIVRTVPLSPPQPGGEPMGRWDGNALLTIQDHLSAEPLLHVHDISGVDVQPIVLQVPGVELMQISNNRFSKAADGRLAIAGAGYGHDRGGGFLAIIDPDRTHQIVVRTEPFVPYAIEFASDGTLWAVGLDNDEYGRVKRADANYFVLRRFDRRGRLISGSILSGTFGLNVAPVDGSVLISSPDRVGWLIPMAHRYVEFGLDGKRLSDYKIDVDIVRMQGVALCDDNSLWVSFRGSGESDLKSFDRVTGTLAHRLSRKPFLYLYGCSGTTLVTTSNWLDLTWLATR